MGVKSLIRPLWLQHDIETKFITEKWEKLKFVLFGQIRDLPGDNQQFDNRTSAPIRSSGNFGYLQHYLKSLGLQSFDN